jgi:hypothetical protein
VPKNIARQTPAKRSKSQDVLVSLRPDEPPLGSLTSGEKRWITAAFAHLNRIYENRKAGRPGNNAACVFEVGKIYVQFLAPWDAEQLVCEAVSAKSVPGIVGILGTSGRRVLRRLGFMPPEISPNYLQKIKIHSVEDLGYAARLAFRTLKEGYRVADFNSATFEGTTPQTGTADDLLMNFIRKHGLPQARERYFLAHWGNTPPDPWTLKHEAELPKMLRDWSISEDDGNDEMVVKPAKRFMPRLSLSYMTEPYEVVMDRDLYLSLRRPYVPEAEAIKLVIVAESPPSKGKFFYKPEGKITEPLFKAMMLQLRFTPTSKESGLREFQKGGWVLVDATYEPVNNRKDRNRIIIRDYHLLRKDLAAMLSNRSVPIILVKKNVCRLLERRLTDDGFNVLNHGRDVYFPSTGRQNDFQRQFSEVRKGTKV